VKIKKKVAKGRWVSADNAIAQLKSIIAFLIVTKIASSKKVVHVYISTNTNVLPKNWKNIPDGHIFKVPGEGSLTIPLISGDFFFIHNADSSLAAQIVGVP